MAKKKLTPEDATAEPTETLLEENSAEAAFSSDEALVMDEEVHDSSKEIQLAAFSQDSLVNSIPSREDEWAPEGKATATPSQTPKSDRQTTCIQRLIREA